MAQKLLSSRSAYNRYFGDFRGVDFSSDHTQVHDQRLAYAVNMYKDYSSGQGKALETIPGFRKRMRAPNGEKIYGIHEYSYTDGNEKKKAVLIHAGNVLYRWDNYPDDTDVTEGESIMLPAPSEMLAGTPKYTITLAHDTARIIRVYSPKTGNITQNASLTAPRTLELVTSQLAEGEFIYLDFVRYETTEAAAVFNDMSRAPSTSFIINNRLFLIDGRNYLVYDGATCEGVLERAYIPTTYINIIPGGDNADAGKEYEQRNILSPYFRHTFIGDGSTTEFYMNENELEAVVLITVDGNEIGAGDASIDLDAGKITFKTAPVAPIDAGSANVEITAKKTLTTMDGVTQSASLSDLVTGCTLAAVFDGRVFMTGNPRYPNHIFYCGRNSTGYADPAYFGILDYMQDGVGNARNTAILTVADTLMVLKEDTQQDGSVYFHTALETQNGIQPKIYPSTRGLAGTGCLGAAINFLDDPVFISRLGVEAVGQLSVRYERAIEHRSSLIDAKLTSLPLGSARLAEWNGYLAVLTDGKIFLADSRQKYMHDTGVTQYEWYYLEDIGVWDDQYDEYKFAAEVPNWLEGKSVRYCTECGSGDGACTCGSDTSFISIPISAASNFYDADTDVYSDMRGETANPPDENGAQTGTILRAVIVDKPEDSEEDGGDATEIYYRVFDIHDRLTLEHLRYEAYLCEASGAQTGGSFRPACTLKAIDGVLYFGTENGWICGFNTDKRAADGTIPKQYYAFDGRTIYTGCATKMDNCGIPHMTKSTVKKSTVVKTKSFASSTAKIKVRTNKKMYEQIARINSSVFSFDDLDFADFSFETNDQSLFSIREKEKKWVEKQYFIYSDEYMKPFALYYICYRYVVAGKFKE